LKNNTKTIGVVKKLNKGLK